MVKKYFWKCACKRSFKKRGFLARHLRYNHLYCKKTSQIKCILCGMTFSSRFLFHLHKLKMVNETREFLKQTATKKSTMSLMSLVKNCNNAQYLQTFKVGKTFQCPACNKSIVYYKNFVSHLRYKHNMFCGIKYQPKCNLCGKIFSTGYHFDKHKEATMKRIKTSGKLMNAVAACQGERFGGYLKEFRHRL